MKTKLLRVLPICLLALPLLTGCSKENQPVGLEWSVISNPSGFPEMNDKVALGYEVMVKNNSIDSYAFEWISVKDGSLTIQNLSGNEMDTLISVFHSTKKTLMAGETAFFFMWVETSPGFPLPELLSQTIQFNRISDVSQFTRVIEIPVKDVAPIVLSAPLKARRYAAAGAPSNNSYHRRTINFLDEKFWTSQRYAVDFIGLDAGNRYREGRQDANIDYYGFEDIVYSATAGEIVSMIDTLPDNTPPKVPEINPGALYRAGGNQVVVKISSGAYVFYGNLVKASIDLKVGDKVEIGQPIGRLGNSGNSDAPKLHLQVMDGPDPLRSHGIPWVFDRFILNGYITGYDHANGMIKVNYLTVQKEIASKNLAGDAVVSFE
jgi:murein DD-endopeptidase MepM/ murein hydrolase activator NlpD